MMNMLGLAKLRKQKRIKQSTIAKAIGITPSVYSRIENGKIKLNPLAFPIIADLLGISVYDLCGILYDKKSA